jgi:predicted transcriptional regulator
LSRMQTYNINQVPVVENSQVVGWIDREQLLRALSVYVESKKI